MCVSPPTVRYADTLNADLTFNHDAIRALAWRRSDREVAALQGLRDIGVVAGGRLIVPADRSIAIDRRKVLARELRQVRAWAFAQRYAEHARAEMAARPLREQLIASAELQLTIARDGMGMPLDRAKVAGLTVALERVRALPAEQQLQAADL